MTYPALRRNKLRWKWRAMKLQMAIERRPKSIVLAFISTSGTAAYIFLSDDLSDSPHRYTNEEGQVGENHKLLVRALSLLSEAL